MVLENNNILLFANTVEALQKKTLLIVLVGLTTVLIPSLKKNC